MGTLSSCAMKPTMEKMANPANTDVPQHIQDEKIASLEQEKSPISRAYTSFRVGGGGGASVCVWGRSRTGIPCC